MSEITRTTQEIFLTDQELKDLLKLSDRDQLVDIRRKVIRYGTHRGSTLPDLGFVVVVLKGDQ